MLCPAINVSGGWTSDDLALSTTHPRGSLPRRRHRRSLGSSSKSARTSPQTIGHAVSLGRLLASAGGRDPK